MEINNTETYSPQIFKSWVERNGFADWALALMWIVIAFISFQVIVGIIAGIAIVESAGPSVDPANFKELMLANLDIVFIGNSAGQILFFGLATFLVTRLHTSKKGVSQFLRFKTHSNTPIMAGATALLILSIQPSIWFLAWLNGQIPVPDFFENLQLEQMEMIKQYLKGDHLIWLTLFHVGVVPAVCEEIMYRGYVMRAFEKSWGILPAIFISGLIFGLYHLQLANLLPLATIGIALGFITWTSKSIYPAMLAHLINNGGSVLVGIYYPNSSVAELSPSTLPPLWAVGLSLVVSSYLIYFMYQQYQQMSTGENYV